MIMETYAFSITEINNGFLTPVGITLKHLPHDYELQLLFGSMRLIGNLHDKTIAFSIPHCVDIDSHQFVFLRELTPYLLIPNLDDIEACYYDDSGLPDEVRNYYGGVIIYNAPTIIDALNASYPNRIFEPNFFVTQTMMA